MTKISRKLSNGKEEFTPKRKKFVTKYIENGGNGTQAVLDTYNTDSSNVANQIALENLRKPTVIRAIDQVLQGVGLTDDVVAKIHKRNMTQDKDLRVSQTAVKDYYGVTGKLEKAGDNTQVNVAFIINKKG